MATGPISGPVSAGFSGLPRGLSRLEHPGVEVGEWGGGRWSVDSGTIFGAE